MRSFRMRTLRPFSLGTRRLVTGSQFDADAPMAGDLIRTRQAVLVDERDLIPLLRALRQPGDAPEFGLRLER